MRVFIITFTLLATMALLSEGKPAHAAGKGAQKRLENSKRMNEKYSDLIGEECEDVCPPIPGNSTSALECASCIVSKTGLLNLADFLSAIASGRFERNCTGRTSNRNRQQSEEKLEPMDETSEESKSEKSPEGSGETEESKSPKGCKPSKSCKSGNSDSDGSGEIEESSDKSDSDGSGEVDDTNQKSKKMQGRGQGKGIQQRY